MRGRRHDAESGPRAGRVKSERRPLQTAVGRRQRDLERQTVRNAPSYAENCVGQSARVGRGPAEFTSAGRGGACRPYEKRRAVKPIGVLAGNEASSRLRRPWNEYFDRYRVAGNLLASCGNERELELEGGRLVGTDTQQKVVRISGLETLGYRDPK